MGHDCEGKSDREIIVELHTNQQWVMKTLSNHLSYHEKRSLQDRNTRVIVLVAAISAIISMVSGILQFLS